MTKQKEQTNDTVKKSNSSQNDSNFNAQALFLFTKLSIWIVGPVLIAILIGKWLDEKYNTEPWLFLASVAIAFIISMTGLIKNSMKEINKIK